MTIAKLLQRSQAGDPHAMQALVETFQKDLLRLGKMIESDAIIEKFVGDAVGPFIKKCGIADKVGHKKLVIPGYAAGILGDLEEELPGWEITVGPREAAHLPGFLKMWKS